MGKPKRRVKAKAKTTVRAKPKRNIRNTYLEKVIVVTASSKKK